MIEQPVFPQIDPASSGAFGQKHGTATQIGIDSDSPVSITYKDGGSALTMTRSEALHGLCDGVVGLVN